MSLKPSFTFAISAWEKSSLLYTTKSFNVHHRKREWLTRHSSRDWSNCHCNCNGSEQESSAVAEKPARRDSISNSSRRNP